MRLLYTILIYCYQFIIRIASLFNPKAKKWVEGRKKQFAGISQAVGEGDRMVWFHCASLGEFEQGKPVMEAVKRQFPNHKIFLTFFSPSGYEIRKNTEVADYVFYLPADTPSNARKLIKIVNPRIAVFIKYEFWFNYINELSRNKIPTLIVSAIFRPSQYFFKPWGFWSSHHLQKITYFLVQDETSLELLNKINVYHADVSGDTRFDRVVKLAAEKKTLPDIERFGENKILIVAGSTWPPDEEILYDLFMQLPEDYRLVVAPHEVTKEHVDQVMKKFVNFSPVKLTEINTSGFSESRVLIIDNVGILSSIYHYAKIAYIGGGFGAGIHNVLEAATYGMPVVFGPRYRKFREARELIEKQAAFSVEDSDGCISTINELMNNEEKYRKVCTDALLYVQKNAGATNHALDKIKSYLISD